MWVLSDVTVARAARLAPTWTAKHDPVTELANRREFERRLAEHIGSRRSDPVSVLWLDLDRFDHLARTTPVLANLRPAGKYLMEDFYYAGGLRAMLVQLGDLLDTAQRTVEKQPLELPAGPATLGEHRSKQILQRYGVPVVRETLLQPAAIEALTQPPLPFPLTRCVADVEALNLPDAERTAILGGNAVALFRLPTP